MDKTFEKWMAEMSDKDFLKMIKYNLDRLPVETRRELSEQISGIIAEANVDDVRKKNDK